MDGVLNYRIDLWAVFIFLGIVQAFFLSFFFLSKENRKIQANVWQGLFLIVVAGCILEIFLMYTGYIVHCFYMVDFSESIALLIGPSIYLMVISLIKRRVGRWDYLHLLPAIIYTFFLIPFLALPEEAKYNAWISSYHPELPFKNFEYPYNADPFRIRRHITGVIIFSILLYGVLSLIVTFRAFKQKKESLLKPKSATLKNLQYHVGQLLFGAILIVIVKLNNPNDTGDHIFATYIALTIYMTSFFVMRNSGFFRPPLLHEQQKYKTSSLTSEQLHSTLTRVKDVMANEKLFLQPSFSLPDLAQRLSVPVHTLSQVINEGMNKTFFELLAEYRVEEAKRLLKEQMNVKIEDIAEQVGYNSKSSFTTVFKKITGKTPGEFRST